MRRPSFVPESNSVIEELRYGEVGPRAPDADGLGLGVAMQEGSQPGSPVSRASRDFNRQNRFTALDDKVDFLVPVAPIKNALASVDESRSYGILDKTAIKVPVLDCLRKGEAAQRGDERVVARDELGA